MKGRIFSGEGEAHRIIFPDFHQLQLPEEGEIFIFIYLRSEEVMASVHDGYFLSTRLIL